MKNTIKELRSILTVQEYKDVTTFLAIYDKDINNGVQIEDDCSDSYKNMNDVAIALRDMFIDQCGDLEKEELRLAFWQNWIISITTAYRKICNFNRNGGNK